MLSEPDMLIYLNNVYTVAFMLQEPCIVEAETGPQSLTCLVDGLIQKTFADSWCRTLQASIGFFFFINYMKCCSRVILKYFKAIAEFHQIYTLRSLWLINFFFRFIFILIWKSKDSKSQLFMKVWKWVLGPSNKTQASSFLLDLINMFENIRYLDSVRYYINKDESNIALALNLLAVYSI